jgi:predicted alpha/beta hydrolase family esterase
MKTLFSRTPRSKIKGEVDKKGLKMKNTKQVIVVRGGVTFETEAEFINNLKTCEANLKDFQKRINWKNNLDTELGDGYSVLLPQMPNKENAKYEFWKIWFERMFPFLESGVILIGSSLGGTFLAKYLAENTYPKKITQLHLVAPAHNATVKAKDFEIPSSLEKLADQADKIYIYWSEDDQIVPYSDFELFKKQLPTAKTIVLNGRGHFSVETFPELIKNIKD